MLLCFFKFKQSHVVHFDKCDINGKTENHSCTSNYDGEGHKSVYI